MLFDKFAESNSFDPLLPDNWYKITRSKISSMKVYSLHYLLFLPSLLYYHSCRVFANFFYFTGLRDDNVYVWYQSIANTSTVIP